jgi:hypothetical protein
MPPLPPGSLLFITVRSTILSRFCSAGDVLDLNSEMILGVLCSSLMLMLMGMLKLSRRLSKWT